ncbi:choice-of-anchor I family protein [Roseomonas elaeocarpi]|uniref:Choice-of-anchor I family protein n=1 Tax=Roseomonas elaeocarpi TaxID=907779 RepID=A0ABV6JLT6_9PROT
MAGLTASSLWSFNNSSAAGAVAGGAEVVEYDATRQIVLSLGPNGVDVLQASDGALRFSLPKSDLGTLGSGNSVAVSGNIVAVTYDGPEPATNGTVAFYELDAAGTSATLLRTVTVGAVPDNVVFTADGTQVLVAIEGEPAPDYTADPVGGVAVIDVATGVASFAGFGSFDTAALVASGVRITGPEGTTAATDIEPEYIALSADGTKAYVTLQENNAIGVLDLTAKGGPAFTAVLPLGTKDFSLEGNGFDASDRDGGVNIANWPVSGLYMPDGIATFQQDGVTYLVTANEGDTREWGDYVDSARLSTLTLDPTIFPDAAALQADDALGRLNVSTVDGDTDGDGDIDVITTFGARSISIWEVTDTGLVQTYDSGDLIERTLAADYPELLDDSRSDNKGPEPEGITLGTVNGQLYAFAGLERSNAIMAFRIDGPADVSYAGTIANEGDVAPEVFTFVPAEESTSGSAELLIGNETSGNTRAVALNEETSDGSYTLQILHGSDFEAGLLAVDRAKNFAAIVDKLEDEVPNSITLSSGDNFIPGPFIAAGTDPTVRAALIDAYAHILGVPAEQLSGLTLAAARADIAILNAIGVQASTIGNHDLDLGTNAFADAIDFIKGTGTTSTSVTNIGALFPFLSADLDFSGDAALQGLYTTELRDAASYGATAADLASPTALAALATDQQIAPWSVIEEGGQKIGILGVTTQLEASLTSVGSVTVKDPAGDGGVDNTDELAAVLQPYVDQMIAQGLNKIILLSHLQQYQLELDLATKLTGVDVIVAGGSHQIFADGDDVLANGDTAAQTYPVVRTGADGNPVVVVNTGNEYSYVGRLNVTFDANGVIQTDAIDPALNGPIATTDANVAALWGSEDPFAEGTRGGTVAELTDAIGTVIESKDGNVFGYSDVYLNGLRNSVRTEETNLGNLTADAFLYAGRLVDGSVTVALHNGGGIRAEIGSYASDATATPLPPAANPDAGKALGGVSQLDIENSLRFNNNLSLVTVTAAELKQLLEWNAALYNPGTTPGGFDQYGGLAYSFDPAGTAQVLSTTDGSVVTAGSRVANAAILDDDGSVADVLIQDGVLVGDADRTIRIATFDFITTGGDNNPLKFYAEDRVDLLNSETLAAAGTELGITGPAAGSEQWALAAYMRAKYADQDYAFAQADTAQSGDTRIQNLAVQTDSVFQAAQTAFEGGSTLTGTTGSDLLQGGTGNDIFLVSTGRDTVVDTGGQDTLVFTALGRADGGLTKAIGGGVNAFTWVDSGGDSNTTHWSGVETVRFADGELQFDAQDTGVKVALLYQALLDREAGALDLALSMNYLRAGGTLEDLAVSVANSDEAAAATSTLSNGDFVRHLYADAVLGREVDADGEAYWTGLLDAGTSTRAQVALTIISSAEAAADPTGLATQGVLVGNLQALEVGHAYQAVLGRGAEAGGLDFWSSQLEKGVAEADLVRAFANSVEFHTRYDGTTDENFVTALYESHFDRQADAAGAQYWTDALGAGLSRAEVEVAFYSSAETTQVLTGLAQQGLDLI